MAWLQNLAGKAEDFLVKIDQNAATVLSEGHSKSTENIYAVTQPVDYEKSVKKTIERNSSLNVLSDLDSVKGIEDDLIINIRTDNLNVDTDNQKPLKENTNEDNLPENYNTSDKLSASSISTHNSFIINQELDFFREKVAKLEVETQDLNKQLLNIHHLYSEVRNENVNLQYQLERTSEQLSVAQREKEQYVARAQRILHEKEKLISMKQDNSIDETDNVFVTYNEGLKTELEFQQDKNAELTEQIKKLLHDIDSLQMQQQVIQNGLHQSNQSLEKSLLNEKHCRNIAEEECLQKTKELQMKNQELLQTQDSLKAKSDEIKILRGALRQKDNNDANIDYESRIQTLTQALMVKQNTLETVTTEKNSLKLHLEKLETEYKNKITQLTRDKAKVINIQDTSDERTSVPNFMRASPFDAGVTRRVKNAYSTLDAISIRTGVFLRRYPHARVFVFTYMVVLQLWVLFVLFVSAPSNR